MTYLFIYLFKVFNHVLFFLTLSCIHFPLPHSHSHIYHKLGSSNNNNLLCYSFTERESGSDVTKLKQNVSALWSFTEALEEPPIRMCTELSFCGYNEACEFLLASAQAIITHTQHIVRLLFPLSIFKDENRELSSWDLNFQIYLSFFILHFWGFI